MINHEQLEKWDLIFDDSKIVSPSQKVSSKELTIKCTDNCTVLSIDKWSDEEYYFLTFYKNHKPSFWYRLKQAFKYAFKGERMLLADIIVKEEDFNKLREF